MASKVLLLFVVLIFLLVIGMEGRILWDNSKSKDGESTDLLRRLGYNVSELTRIGRELSVRNEVDRFSPGGPDPQHHSYPLSSKP
ncbi:PREDICTED: CLAVATA3/ESR (CLE)-related protein 7-like [Camelina sativa]|uniref:CLAVATA3/ESR (CLE)-related protein 7-like n=1 Tax=Camelina sativa TaxID=90675 RepID=A0ABM1R451_CAMSA|nr:PREDICTED: CLAVATA3/ESR (CLE)-related protein 7-like [Camelina sativa]